jgi:hypothetical protein
MARVSVDDYMAALVHTRHAEVEALRSALTAADPDVVETIKWNAPSYGYQGTDRITMRLQPGDRVDLVFHRGAAKRDDAFTFDDPTGLIAWAAPDRGVVAVTDRAMLDARLPEILALAQLWLVATRD